MLEHIFFDILDMTIAASVIILMMEFFLPKLDKQYSLGWRKAFWILLGIRLCIPYNFSWDDYALHLFTLEGSWQLPGYLVPAAAGISLLWFAGACLYVRHHYLCYRRFLVYTVEHSRFVEDGFDYLLLQQIREELGIKREIALYRCDKIHSPMVLQILEPMLVLPDESYTEEQLRLILIHECIHVDNLDLLYKLIMLMAGAVHWFNPLIHRMIKVSYRDVEIFCDQCVTEDMNREERGIYGKTILDAAGQQRNTDIALSTCFYGSRGLMKQRVEHLFYMERKKSGAVIFAGMLILLLLLSVFIKCGV